jgi:hypothetical protein
MDVSDVSKLMGTLIVFGGFTRSKGQTIFWREMPDFRYIRSWIGFANQTYFLMETMEEGS